MSQKVAIIVGNGVTRKSIDLEKLVDKAPIYGCNALYRDFSAWNYLVAIDEGMIDEVRRYHMNKGVLIVPTEEMRYESAEYNPRQRRRTNAGMVAMEESIKRGSKFLYCLGFDFILEGDVSVDNIYKDTENYGPETHAQEEDNYYRIKYLEWFAQKYGDVKFIFVIPDDVKVKTLDSPNIVGMPKSTFLEKITH